MEVDASVVNEKPGLAFENVQSRVPASKPPLMAGLVQPAGEVAVMVVTAVMVVVAVTVGVILDGGSVIVTVPVNAEVVTVTVFATPD